MKKLLNIVAAAAVMISAGAAMAQTGNGSDVTGGTVSATVGGIFTPSGTSTGGPTVTAPAATPVTMAPPAPAAAGVMSGAPAAVAAFTGGLTSAGIPAAAAQGIATALSTLQSGGSVTFGNVASALSSWNTAVASLSAPQLQALIRSPEGRAAFQTLQRARAGAISAGNSAR